MVKASSSNQWGDGRGGVGRLEDSRVEVGGESVGGGGWSEGASTDEGGRASGALTAWRWKLDGEGEGEELQQSGNRSKRTVVSLGSITKRKKARERIVESHARKKGRGKGKWASGGAQSKLDSTSALSSSSIPDASSLLRVDSSDSRASL